MSLETIGPVFVGDGKTIDKKATYIQMQNTLK